MTERIHKVKGVESEIVILKNKDAQRKDLSYEALGMLVYLMSLPPDWIVYVSKLERPGSGRDKVRRIIKELQNNGYVHVEQIHDEAGKFATNAYSAYGSSDYNPHWQPLTEKPLTVEPLTANPQLQRKESDKENKKNKDIAPEALKPAKPYYDAIALHLDIHGGQNVDFEKMLLGTSKKNGYRENNLSPAMELPEFIQWVTWAKKTLGQFMVKAPAKVNGSIVKWRSMGSPSIESEPTEVSILKAPIRLSAEDERIRLENAEKLRLHKERWAKFNADLKAEQAEREE